MSKVIVDADERVLDKLRKLSKKYESIKECSTEAEAQEFARKIQELLTKHKLDMSEVEYQELDDVDPIKQVSIDWESIGFKVKRKRIAWQELLGNFVCQFNFCQMLLSQGSSRVWFVGRTSDVEPAALTFLYLAQVATKIADKEYVKYFYECRRTCLRCKHEEKAHGDPKLGETCTWETCACSRFVSNVQKARGFRSSFLEGFCSRLGQRYRLEQDKIKEEAAKDGKSLVRLTDALVAVREWLAPKLEGKKSLEGIRRTVQNREGYMRGARAADGVPLGRNDRMVQ